MRAINSFRHNVGTNENIEPIAAGRPSAKKIRGASDGVPREFLERSLTAGPAVDRQQKLQAMVDNLKEACRDTIALKTLKPLLKAQAAAASVARGSAKEKDIGTVNRAVEALYRVFVNDGEDIFSDGAADTYLLKDEHKQTAKQIAMGIKKCEDALVARCNTLLEKLGIIDDETRLFAPVLEMDESTFSITTELSNRKMNGQRKKAEKAEALIDTLTRIHALSNYFDLGF